MQDFSIKGNQYTQATEDIYGSEQVGASATKGAKGTETTKIPDAAQNMNGGKKEIPDIPPPESYVDPSKFNDECGTMLDSLAKVIGELQKLMSKQREMNTDLMVSNLQQAKQENLKAAEDMKADANKAMIMQIVGAGLSIAASAVSLGLSVKACSKQMNIEKGAEARTENYLKGLDEQAAKTTTAATDATTKAAANTTNKVADTANKAVETGANEVKNATDKVAKEAEKVAEKTAEKAAEQKDVLTKQFTNQIDAENKATMAWGKAWDGVATASKSVMDSIAGNVTSKSQAKVREADAKVQELQSLIERLKEINESVKDVQRKSLETLSSVSQAEIDVLRKISV